MGMGARSLAVCFMFLIVAECELYTNYARCACERGQTTFQAADAEVAHAALALPCLQIQKTLFRVQINVLFFDGTPAEAAVTSRGRKGTWNRVICHMHTCLARVPRARRARASAIHSLLRSPQSDFNCGALLSLWSELGRTSDRQRCTVTSVHTQCDMELLFLQEHV